MGASGAGRMEGRAIGQSMVADGCGRADQINFSKPKYSGRWNRGVGK